MLLSMSYVISYCLKRHRKLSKSSLSLQLMVMLIQTLSPRSLQHELSIHTTFIIVHFPSFQLFYTPNNSIHFPLQTLSPLPFLSLFHSIKVPNMSKLRIALSNSSSRIQFDPKNKALLLGQNPIKVPNGLLLKKSQKQTIIHKHRRGVHPTWRARSVGYWIRKHVHYPQSHVRPRHVLSCYILKNKKRTIHIHPRVEASQKSLNKSWRHRFSPRVI